MTLTITDTDGGGHYTLTVRRVGGAEVRAVELRVERDRHTERVIIDAREWAQLCKVGGAL